MYPHHAVQLCLRHLWSLLRLRIERIANPASPGPGHAFLNKLLVNTLLDENPRSGAARLSLVDEDAHVRAFDCRIHIGVGKYDVGALAAQLERGAFSGWSGRQLPESAGRFSWNR